MSDIGVNIGSDFSCFEDMDPGLTIVDGRTCLAQAIARRLITQTGTLLYDRQYGQDIRQLLSRGFNQSNVSSLIEFEAAKDERVLDIRTKVIQRDENGEIVEGSIGAPNVDSVEVKLMVYDGDGPFPMTVQVSGTTAKLLYSGAQ